MSHSLFPFANFILVFKLKLVLKPLAGWFEKRERVCGWHQVLLKSRLKNIEIKWNDMYAFEHFSQISLHIKTVNTTENQQQ